VLVDHRDQFSFVAEDVLTPRESAELKVILEEFDLDPCTDKIQSDHNRVVALMVQAVVDFPFLKDVQKRQKPLQSGHFSLPKPILTQQLYALSGRGIAILSRSLDVAD
jgi:hypothetical protein